MASNEDNARTATPAPVNAVLWRTYDDGGWKLLDDGQFEKARYYFEQARRKVVQFPADDYRVGRTLAGSA